jgi:two-component system sensor histidine kinase RpfC
VGMLGSAIKTLKTSVDAVLQMSKLEAGAERAEKRLFNLWFFVHQLSAIVRPQSVAKGVAWSVAIDPAVPTAVRGDPTHLSHVLGNLVNNAFKFTSAGGVTLRVSPGAGAQVRVEVVDTGIGIPLDQQERLFERFVQVDSSATRKFGGTGLGTSIARDLTELMRGRIGVVSAPGKGSTFWIEIPLEPSGAVSAIDWMKWREVLVIGRPEPRRDEVAREVRALGLAPVIVDTTQQLPNPGSGTCLATILALPAKEAAALWASMLREDAECAACPAIVADDCSAAERASLIAGGVADVLPAAPAHDALAVALAALVHRLEIPGESSARALADTGIVRPLDIVLADDNKSNQLLLARILQDAGHRVVTADCGGDAFDAMSRDGVGLAILDLNMPDMSGPDVIKLFRASSIGARKLPVIILSADATPAAKQQSLEAGADEFLTKPVSAATLLATIERIAAGNASRDADVGDTAPQARETPQVLVDAERIAALRRIARGDARFLDKYITAAFAEIEKAISDLRVAASRGDPRAARDAIHIIEGTGGSIGAVALVANCKSIRNYLAVPRDPDCAAALAELSTTYALTKSAVQATLHHAGIGALRSRSGN